MTYFESHQLIAGINLLLCLGVMWACICRLNSPVSKRNKMTRTRYTILLGGAFLMGFQPMLWNTWPTKSSIGFVVTILIYLALNIPRWRSEESNGDSKRNQTTSY